jgi:anti-anti-sigma factor
MHQTTRALSGWSFARGLATQVSCSSTVQGGTLELSDKHVDSAAILTVKGRVDMVASDTFREHLLTMLTGGLPLVIDFSGVDYISSAGLRALMLGSKQARSTGTQLAIAALQPVVLEIFQISRFDKLLPCHPTVDAALAAIRPGSGG